MSTSILVDATEELSVTIDALAMSFAIAYRLSVAIAALE